MAHQSHPHVPVDQLDSHARTRRATTCTFRIVVRCRSPVAPWRYVRPPEHMATNALPVGARVVIGLGARILLRKGSAKDRELPVSSERLERPKLAVEAIAVEVERISTSLRRTVRLLSARLPTKTDDRSTIPATRAAQQRHGTARHAILDNAPPPHLPNVHAHRMLGAPQIHWAASP